MSVYAEYLNAESEDERQMALSGMKWDAYMDELHEDEEEDDDEWED